MSEVPLYIQSMGWVRQLRALHQVVHLHLAVRVEGSGFTFRSLRFFELPP